MFTGRNLAVLKKFRKNTKTVIFKFFHYSEFRANDFLSTRKEQKEKNGITHYHKYKFLFIACQTADQVQSMFWSPLLRICNDGGTHGNLRRRSFAFDATTLTATKKALVSRWALSKYIPVENPLLLFLTARTKSSVFNGSCVPSCAQALWPFLVMPPLFTPHLKRSHKRPSSLASKKGRFIKFYPRLFWG